MLRSLVIVLIELKGDIWRSRVNTASRLIMKWHRKRMKGNYVKIRKLPSNPLIPGRWLLCMDARIITQHSVIPGTLAGEGNMPEDNCHGKVVDSLRAGHKAMYFRCIYGLDGWRI